jgi:phage tail sheath protein FI
VNRTSKWVWAGIDAVDATSVTDEEFSLSGGTDAAPSSVASLYSTAFGDSETLDVNLIIGGAVSSADANTIIAVAAARKECVAFVSPPIVTADAAATKTWADSINSSSYGVLDSGVIYVYDKYNDAYRWIGNAGNTAGLCAYTDGVADAWFSPAGFTRGVIRGVTKLKFNPTQAERDTLYKARVNPIASFPGQGIVLYGDKTAQSKPSAFDRINVRRLFITMEKAISTAAKFQLFEFNDEFTRAQFRNLVEPFLRDIQGRRGITDFAVVCDETNNTGEVIDSNRFVADIFVKPARSINFITLNFIATRTGVEFSEVVGQ